MVAVLFFVLVWYAFSALATMVFLTLRAIVLDTHTHPLFVQYLVLLTVLWPVTLWVIAQWLHAKYRRR